MVKAPSDRNKGGTVGITLRLSKELLEFFVRITNEANLLLLERGEAANFTVQDAIRNQLELARRDHKYRIYVEHAKSRGASFKTFEEWLNS
jgi:hypothetical protein